MSYDSFEYGSPHPIEPYLRDHLLSVKRLVKDNYEINEVPPEVVAAMDELELAYRNVLESDLALQAAMKPK